MVTMDNFHNVKGSYTIVPIVGNNTTEGTGTAVDISGYESATLVICYGDSGDTLSGTVYITPKLQHSDTTTAGDFADVDAADQMGTLSVIDAPAEDQCIQMAGYKGTKRYLRALLTFSGTHTNGIPIAAFVLLGHAKRNPAQT